MNISSNDIKQKIINNPAALPTDTPSIQPQKQPDVGEMLIKRSDAGEIPVESGNTEKSAQELAQKLGTSVDIIYKVLKSNPEFLELSVPEQLTIIKKANTEEPEKNVEVNKLNYNNADIPEKKLIILDELAKNLYVNRKDIDKQQALEEWQNSESLRSEKTQELTEKLKSDKYLQGMISDVENNPKLTDKDKNSLLDFVMLSIQSANKKGISFMDYIKLDESERADSLVEYLQDSKFDLNSTENEDLEQAENIKAEVLNVLKEQHGIDLPKDVKPSEIFKYAEELNLDSGKILYDNLSAKKDNGTLSAKEEEHLKYLEKIYKTPAGQDIVDKAMASNLEKLEAKFNELDAKIKSGTASEDEKKHYSVLQKTLNSEESKRLKQIDLPVPESEYDKKVIDGLNDFKKAFSGKVNSNILENATLIQYIEDQTKGLSNDDKKKYIETILKYNNDSSSVAVLGKYINDFPELAGNEDLAGTSALVVTEMNEKAQDIFYEANTERVNKHNKKAERAMSSASQVLILHGNIDGKLDKLIEKNAKYAGKTVSVEVNNAASDAAVLIKDVKAQGNALNAIQNGECKNNDEVQVHIVSLADQIAKENQIQVIDTATQNSSKATEYAAKNNVVAKIHKDNQTSAFKIVHQRVQEQFEGEKAIELSCSLADQIQYCDKDNQLAMHNEIMNSKYSQVQEHAASNIRNYDLSVQQSALDTVYKTGNVKAIEAGLNSVSASQSREIIEAVVDNAVCEFALNDESSDIHEKFLAGNLSVEELRLLPANQRREYFETYFKKLPVEQKIKLLSSIPHNMKKTVYTMLARSNSILFNIMCKNADTVQNMLEMGLPVDVHNKIEGVVKFMAGIDNSFRLIADKYKIKYDSTVNKYVTPINLASEGNHFITKDKFSIYRKDKSGNFIG